MKDPRIDYKLAKTWDSETDFCAKEAIRRQDKIERIEGELSAYIHLGTVEHLTELVKAESEGRVVVLPCNVGDTVWTNFAMSGWYFRDKDKPYSAKVVFVGLNSSEDMGGGFVNIVYGKHDHMMQFNFSDIGKTVFLTRNQAEAALGGEVEAASD